MIFDAQGNPLPQTGEAPAREFGDFLDRLLKTIEAEPGGFAKMVEQYESLAIQLTVQAESLHLVSIGQRQIDQKAPAGQALLQIVCRMTVMGMLFTRKQVYEERDRLEAAQKNGGNGGGSDSPGASAHDGSGSENAAGESAGSRSAGEAGSGEGGALPPDA